MTPAFCTLRIRPRAARALGLALLLAGPLWAGGIVLARPAAAQESHGELVPWDQAGDFASVLARAKKAQKLVFVDFYATWCGPCKLMDRTVYSDSSVARTAAHFVNRKVDAEKGEGVALARRYGIQAYPTLVIVDATGKEVARETGYRPADRFRRFLDDTRSGRGTVAGLEKMILRGGDTFENNAALGEKLAESGDLDRARRQLDHALTINPADPGGRGADLLLSIARSRAQAGDAAGAVADAAAFLARFPASPRRVEGIEIKANAHAALAQGDSAVFVFRQLVDSRPDDPAALVSFARFCAAHEAGLDQALVAGQKAVELTAGKDADALDALAGVYSARGQYDEAVSSAERALDANPNRGDLRARLERFQELAVAAVRAKSR
ncbi:MAG: thioredoxin domain-containing protein [Candidatus Eisenbacteria bacterium]